MWLRRGAFVLLVGTLAAGLGGLTGGASATPGVTNTTSATSTTVAAPTVLHLTFVDRSRPTDDPNDAHDAPDRTLATTVVLPAGTRPAPLVLLAHGADGDPAKFTQLMGAWAAAGYVVAAPAFPLTGLVNDRPRVFTDFVNQPDDLRFVLTSLLRESRRAQGTLHGRIDPRHVGAAGMSLGGATVFGLASCCVDPRIDALVLMDAVHLPFPGDPPVDFTTPVMFVHIDTDPVAPYRASAEAYAAAGPPKFLMTLHGGLHPEPYEDTPSPHDGAVVAATTAFWDTYLRGRRAAVAEITRAGTVAGLSDVSGDTGG